MERRGVAFGELECRQDEFLAVAVTYRLDELPVTGWDWPGDPDTPLRQLVDPVQLSQDEPRRATAAVTDAENGPFSVDSGLVDEASNPSSSLS